MAIACFLFASLQSPLRLSCRVFPGLLGFVVILFSEVDVGVLCVKMF